MKTINENTVIATGREISKSGLFPHIQPTDTQVFLWIKWNWGIKNESPNFAPIVELFPEMKDGSTHKLSKESLYFHLPQNVDGSYMFEQFIARFLPIEQV